MKLGTSYHNNNLIGPLLKALFQTCEKKANILPVPKESPLENCNQLGSIAELHYYNETI